MICPELILPSRGQIRSQSTRDKQIHVWGLFEFVFVFFCMLGGQEEKEKQTPYRVLHNKISDVVYSYV